jgi:dolichol-phosphate mannosyltransferase
MNSGYEENVDGLLISVVIPALNEEQNILPIFQEIQLSLAGLNFEVIFVDDGSSDGTSERIRNLRADHSSVRLLRFGRNFGQQSALLAGMAAARGAAVITLDCDLQHPPHLFPSMIRAWRDGAKVVQMVRKQSDGIGLRKKLASRLFYSFINILSETPVVRDAADFQLLDRVVVNAIVTFKDRYPFIRGLVGWLGFPVVTIGYVAPRRLTGATGYTHRKMLRLSLHAVLGLSSKPLRFSFYFGLVTAAFCLSYLVFALVALAAGRTVQGWTSVIVMVTFLGSVQLVSIGIVGEYLARIYDNSRGIPQYVIVEGDDAPTPHRISEGEGSAP